MIKPSVSVFFPCFNDEKTISQLVMGAKKVLEKAAAKYEIIVIDDGSTDDSRGELSKLRREIRNLRLIFHRQNRGYGGVLRSGFKAAKYDLVFYTDGDGQYDVRDLELLFPLFTPDIDVVNGIKMERNDAWYRKLAGYGYNFLVRNLFNIRIFDVDCDFRLIRKIKLQGINLRCSSGAICVELVKKLQDNGAGFREVTVHHYERKYGKSQFFNPKRILETARELVSLWTSLYLTKS